MEKRKLKPDQIQTLFEFIEQKGVKFYDLQIELVDHFASAIEAKWEQAPDRDFTVLMTEVYRSFNDYEFKRLIRTKMKALNRRSWRMAWSFCRSFLTWPKIALTLLAVVTLHQFIGYFQNGVDIFRWFALVLFAVIISFGVYLYRNRPKRKKFLVFNQTVLLLLAWFNLIAIFFVQFPSWFDLENTSLTDAQVWGVSGFMVFIALMFIGFFFYSRRDMHRELEDAFPKYVR